MNTFRRLGFTYLLGCLVCVLLIVSWESISKVDTIVALNRCEKSLEKRKALIISILTKIRSTAHTKTNDRLIRYLIDDHLRLSEQGISFFMYRNGIPLWWSSSQVPVDTIPSIGTFPTFKEVKLLNGIYLISGLTIGSDLYFGTVLTDQLYPIQNDYLENESCPERGKIIHNSSDIPVTVFFLGYLCLLLFVLLSYRSFFSSIKKQWLFTGFVTIIILIRFVLFYFRYPVIVFDSEIFTPTSYASSAWMNSLGDLLLHNLSFLIIAIGFFRYFPFSQARIYNDNRIRLLQVTFGIIIVLSGVIFSQIWTRDIILNSSFSLDLADISNLSFYSILGFISIILIQISFLLLYMKIISRISNLFSSHLSINLIQCVIIMVIVSAITTINLYTSLQQKEKDKREFLAAALINRKNPVTEGQFSQIRNRMLSDTLLKRWFEGSDKNTNQLEDSLENHIQKTYFSGYWLKYNVQITFCDSSRILNIQPKNLNMKCLDYFTEVIRDFGISTTTPDLWFMDYGTGNGQYLLILSNNTEKELKHSTKKIFLEYSSKYSLSDLGYPALLIDKKKNDIPDLSGYSYAVYRSGKLVYGVGTYNYPVSIQKLVRNQSKTHFFHESALDHLCYSEDPETVVIVSRSEATLLSVLSQFSYFLIFFSLVFLIIFFLSGGSISGFLPMQSLNRRLQVTIVGILGGTLLTIGIFVVFYIIQLDTQKNEKSLRERAFSVMVELQHKYAMADSLEIFQEPELENMLVKFSNVFFADINLYDSCGLLLASSRPQIFETGLISKMMNPAARDTLKQGQSSLFIHLEKIGKQKFNSAYMPLYNDRDRLLGYMNLPYFSKQDELTKEISRFLVAFINIYILVILLGIFISILISKRITRPLSILSQRLSEIKLGQMNEKIEWKHQDEIGKLVEEYNHMVELLVVNAEKLARSERESAWREMARQVAHEIKNPLTPMKLSVQYLRKAWEEKAQDWDNRLDRFTKTLINQIDQLSATASEFSDFAKMTEPVCIELDLCEVIHEVIPIYQDFPECSITFIEPENPCLIKADKKQLIRVFTNLINNSIQSILPGDQGTITIEVVNISAGCQVIIDDNGSGIPDEFMDKVFQPYFTTKTSGTGLGLAIVKGLLQMMNGGIELVSNPTGGTKAIIYFPQHNII